MSSNFQIRTLRDSLPIVSALSWFRFVLADFGLSKEQVQARTLQKGSPLFIATWFARLEKRHFQQIELQHGIWADDESRLVPSEFLLSHSAYAEDCWTIAI